MMRTKCLTFVFGMMFIAAVSCAPTNDVTLYIRALYQNCTDSNNDTLAVKFLDGSEKFVAQVSLSHHYIHNILTKQIKQHELSRSVARDALATFSDHNVVYFSSRTNYIDGFIAESLEKDPKISQIVVVAAGFDSRAYRIPFAGKYFELDMPEVVEAKQSKVSENGLKTLGQSVTYVSADLRNISAKDALIAEPTFDRHARTIYIVEGLIYYLHQDDVDILFKSLGEVASTGSPLVFDFTNLCLIEENCSDLNKYLIKIFLKIMRTKKEPWFSGFVPGAVQPWLAQWGFETTELLSFQNAGYPPLNVKSWTNSTIFGQMGFAKAVKK
jgi:methyltransferase (TIGR00027 family)